MLEPDPRQRSTIEEVIAHPWVKSIEVCHEVSEPKHVHVCARAMGMAYLGNGGGPVRSFYASQDEWVLLTTFFSVLQFLELNSDGQVFSLLFLSSPVFPFNRLWANVIFGCSLGCGI